MINGLKFAPIIHSRTYIVDFRDNFMAIPSDFTPEKVEWAKKHILASTSYMEFLEKGSKRDLIFCDGEHCVIGVTIRIKDLCKLTNEEIQETKDMFSRPLFAFLGFVCHVKDLPKRNKIEIVYSEYLKIYKEYVSSPEVWMEKAASPAAKVPYSDVMYDVQEISENRINYEFKDNQISYKNCETNNSRILYYAFYYIAQGKAFSCCTNMANLKMVKDSEFSLTTCKLNESEDAPIIIKKEKNITYNSTTDSNTNKSKLNQNNEVKKYGKFSDNSGKQTYEIKNVEKINDIARLTIIAGGIVYLVTIPLYSIPASIIIGGITLSLGALEITKLLKNSTNNKSNHDIYKITKENYLLKNKQGTTSEHKERGTMKPTNGNSESKREKEEYDIFNL